MAPDRTLRARIVAGHGTAFDVRAELEVEPGITILFGPSGSGKSTLLSAIAGLLAPREGRVSSGDEVWFDAAKGIARPVNERKIAFVFQSLALFPHMTAEDNVGYGMDRALPRAERRERARRVLERLRVLHVADRKPATLSGGEAQRVALARAFAMQPRAMLLDEPFSALDRDLRTELSLEVRAFVEEADIPAIHVTHHRREARRLTDRAILLDGGRVTAVGSVTELIPD
jgi:molybdate transport system ATP-binding protein